nr:hypothetical protein GCM10020093_015390 [Planobispora longispora]
MALVRSELQKLFTTRLWWIMLLVMLLFTGITLAVTIGFAGVEGGQGAPALPGRETLEFQQAAWTAGAGSSIFVMVLGIIMMTGEYRYQTITTTFLTTPRRGRVVTAKLIAGLLVGVLFGLASLLLTAAAVIPAVLIAGGEVALLDGGIPGSCSAWWPPRRCTRCSGSAWARWSATRSRPSSARSSGSSSSRRCSRRSPRCREWASSLRPGRRRA